MTGENVAPDAREGDRVTTQEQIEQIQSQQGWTDETLGNLALAFLTDNNHEDHFLTYLESVQREENGESDGTLNMDKIVKIIQAEGIYAEVMMTGGNVATIYAGPTREEPDGEDMITRYAAIAGPGTYGWGRERSTAYVAEFFIGSDDFGEETPVDAGQVGAVDETLAAALIIAQVTKDDPTKALTDDEVEALGFKGD